MTMSDDLRLRRYESGDDDRIRELHEKALRGAGAYVENVAEFETDLDAIPETYLTEESSSSGCWMGRSLRWVGYDRQTKQQRNSNECASIPHTSSGATAKESS